jgi:DNA-binding GntR family transcriptional regulator
MDLDRSNPIPLYFQMAQRIEDAIVHGDLRPGARLDNEDALATRYSLSRPTVRRAIQHLVDKGLLVRKRGVGTQVVQGQVNRAAKLTSLYEDLTKEGLAPSTKVLQLTQHPAMPNVAKALDVDEGTSVVSLTRLRSTNSGPLALLKNWLPSFVKAPTVAELEGSGLFQLLRGGGLNLRVASQRISARACSPTEAELLAVAAGAPVLTMTRTTFDDIGRPVEYGEDVYRGDRYSFEMTLTDR